MHRVGLIFMRKATDDIVW